MAIAAAQNRNSRVVNEERVSDSCEESVDVIDVESNARIRPLNNTHRRPHLIKQQQQEFHPNQRHNSFSNGIYSKKPSQKSRASSAVSPAAAMSPLSCLDVHGMDNLHLHWPLQEFPSQSQRSQASRISYNSSDGISSGSRSASGLASLGGGGVVDANSYPLQDIPLSPFSTPTQTDCNALQYYLTTSSDGGNFSNCNKTVANKLTSSSGDRDDAHESCSNYNFGLNNDKYHVLSQLSYKQSCRESEDDDCIQPTDNPPWSQVSSSYSHNSKTDCSNGEPHNSINVCDYDRVSMPTVPSSEYKYSSAARATMKQTDAQFNSECSYARIEDDVSVVAMTQSLQQIHDLHQDSCNKQGGNHSPMAQFPTAGNTPLALDSTSDQYIQDNTIVDHTVRVISSHCSTASPSSSYTQPDELLQSTLAWIAGGHLNSHSSPTTDSRHTNKSTTSSSDD